MPGTRNLELNLGRWALDALANLSTVWGPHTRSKWAKNHWVVYQSSKSIMLLISSAQTLSSLGTHWGTNWTWKIRQKSKISSAIECNSALGLPISTIRTAPWLSECHLTDLPWTESLNDVKAKCTALSSLHVELFLASHGLHIRWHTSSVPTRNAPQATLLASEKLSKKRRLVRHYSSRIKTNNVVFPEKYFWKTIVMMPDIEPGIPWRSGFYNLVQKTGFKTSQITQYWWHWHNVACDRGTIPSSNIRGR